MFFLSLLGSFSIFVVSCFVEHLFYLQVDQITIRLHQVKTPAAVAQALLVAMDKARGSSGKLI